MGTQAIISILRNGKTFIKIICGCNGYNAKKLAMIIKNKKVENINYIYKLALNQKFGCRDCLVVMNNEDLIYDGDDKDYSFSLYRETFDNPSFNPRWKYGTADYVIINLDNDKDVYNGLMINYDK